MNGRSNSLILGTGCSFHSWTKRGKKQSQVPKSRAAAADVGSEVLDRPGGFAPAFPAGPEGSLVMKINLCLFSVPGDLGEGQPPPLGTHKSKSFWFCRLYTYFLPFACWVIKPQVF